MDILTTESPERSRSESPARRSFVRTLRASRLTPAGRYAATERRLLETFGGGGWRPYQAFPRHERRVIDPHLTYINEHVDGITKDPDRPYAWIATFAPTLQGRRGVSFEIEIKLDFATGSLDVVSTAHALVPGTMRTASLYQIDHAGRDLARAVSIAQQRFDALFDTYRATSRGRRCELAPHRAQTPLSPLTFWSWDGVEAHPFDAARPALEHAVIDAVATMSKQLQRQRERAELQQSRKDQAAKLGYVTPSRQRSHSTPAL